MMCSSRLRNSHCSRRYHQASDLQPFGPQAAVFGFVFAFVFAGPLDEADVAVFASLPAPLRRALGALVILFTERGRGATDGVASMKFA